MQPHDTTSDDVPLKRCSKCKEEFPAAARYFYRDPTTPDGFDYRCKRCLSSQRGTKFREPAPPTPESHKWCRGCQLIKPLQEFHLNRGRKDGYHTRCKKCLAEQNGYRYRPPARPGFKFCSVCKGEFPATNEYFYSDNRSKFGLSSRCKTCTIKKAAEWQEENPERSRERRQNWATNNPDKTRESSRLSYHRNKARYALYWREHREQHRVNGRKSYYKDVERSRAKARENTRRWYRNNPVAARAVVQRRAARKRALPDNFTATDWQRALDYFNGCCAVCERPMNGLFHAPHADHWIPLSNPDCPGTVPDNMVPLCGGADGCNQRKHNRTAADWLNTRYGKRKAAAILARVEAYFDWVRAQ